MITFEHVFLEGGMMCFFTFKKSQKTNWIKKFDWKTKLINVNYKWKDSRLKETCIQSIETDSH